VTPPAAPGGQGQVQQVVGQVQQVVGQVQQVVGQVQRVGRREPLFARRAAEFRHGFTGASHRVT